MAEDKGHHCSHGMCAHDQDIKKITIVLVLITVFFLLELWGHHRTHSLSLLADALHLLVDISGFVVSILTLRLAKKPSDNKMNFGYQRLEIIGALFSVFLIWGAVVYLIVESVHRYLHPNEIDGKVFLEIAIVGLFINLVCMAILHSHGHSHDTQKKTLNMRATYIHVVGDIIQSIGVIIASAIIFYNPKLVIADIICTAFFAILVFFSTIPVIRDAIGILSERAPTHINQEEIKQSILEYDGVLKVTDIKVWSVATNSHAISLKILSDHILIKQYENILSSVRKYLHVEHGFGYINIQIDTPITNKEYIGLGIEKIKFKEVV